MKGFLTLLFFGLLGGIVGGYFFISLSGFNSADISEAVVSLPTATAIPSHGFWEKIISEASLSTVGIQVFQSNRLLKQGSGIIVSSDGLIVTVGDLAASNAVYQVSYEDKIIRGKIISTDYNLNLILIKTENSYSNVASLGADNYHSGQEVVLMGKILDLSNSSTFSQKGMISYVTPKNVVIDTSASTNLTGTGVVDSDGYFAGLAYLRNGKVNMVRGITVDNFFKTYSSKIK